MSLINLETAFPVALEAPMISKTSELINKTCTTLAQTCRLGHKNLTNQVVEDDLYGDGLSDRVSPRLQR